MEQFVITGKFTLDELSKALKVAFPERNVVATSKSFKKEDKKVSNSNDVFISTLHQFETFQQLSSKLEEKEKDLKDAEESASKAIVSIQTLHKQQQALFDEFALLRQRYDEQKTSIINILWNQCARYHPDLRQIPNIEGEDFVEVENQVGDYSVGEMLGEGQFATVRNCLLRGNPTEYALKIIKKERITSFNSLMRVSNEIDNLRKLKSPFIVSVMRVIHTQNILYIITEKGGRDLFEFFDEHPDGVPELWAREIISCVLKGVLYCHEQGICHRDLKPENILVSFDTETEKCIDLKLCDFGLSTKFKTKVALTDFCGSPGFFAPEMWISGSYFGDKVDVWSVGCILLELVLGHEKFCDIWMAAYEYEVLQNKELFTSSINETVEQLPDFLHFSDPLNDFLLKFLDLKSSRRPTIRQIGVHPWLDHTLDEEITRLNNLISTPTNHHHGSHHGQSSHPHAQPAVYTPPPLSPVPSSSNTATHLHLNQQQGGGAGGGGMRGLTLFDPQQYEDPNYAQGNGSVNPDNLRAAYGNLSEKERRQMEEYYKSASGEQMTGMKLPPITPATPSIGNAKKLLRKGNEIATKTAQEHGTGDNQGFEELLNCSDVENSMNGGMHFFGSPTSRSPLPSVAEGFGSYDDLGMSVKETLRISTSLSPRSHPTANTTANTTVTTPIQQKPATLFASNSESFIK